MELPQPKFQAASNVDAAASANIAAAPTAGILERIMVNKGDKVSTDLYLRGTILYSVQDQDIILIQA
jgi:biotin carboxyl carrier protein